MGCLGVTDAIGPDLKGRAVIGDDKDHSKIWVPDQVDLNRYVAKFVELDRHGPEGTT